MPAVIIDACCLIDLFASGHAKDILHAGGLSWHVATAVQGEIRYLRQYDPAQPGQVVKVPADLSGLISSGVLTTCAPEETEELDHFTRYAALFRSDGEAMCLAIAEKRAWILATDDRRAIRVAQGAGLKVVCCPELVKTWAEVTRPDHATLSKVLHDIQDLAQFKPNPSMPDYEWWVAQLARGGP